MLLFKVINTDNGWDNVVALIDAKKYTEEQVAARFKGNRYIIVTDYVSDLEDWED